MSCRGACRKLEASAIPASTVWCVVLYCGNWHVLYHMVQYHMWYGMVRYAIPRTVVCGTVPTECGVHAELLGRCVWTAVYSTARYVVALGRGNAGIVTPPWPLAGVTWQPCLACVLRPLGRRPSRRDLFNTNLLASYSVR